MRRTPPSRWSSSTATASPAKPTVNASAAALRQPGHAVPAYTSDAAINTTLASLGVDQTVPSCSPARMHQRLVSLRAAAEKVTGHSVLDFTHAYVLHLTNASVATAVERLRASGAVAYAAPNWTVTTTHTSPVPVTKAQLAQARQPPSGPERGQPGATPGCPTNYALTSSAQALLNRPGVDAVPAYSQIADQTGGQLPGAGRDDHQRLARHAHGRVRGRRPERPLQLLRDRVRPDHRDHQRPALHRLAVDAADPDVHRRQQRRARPDR